MSAAQLSAPTTVFAELAVEAALAARICRTAHMPSGLLEWLSHTAAAPGGLELDRPRSGDPQVISAFNPKSGDYGYGVLQSPSDPQLVAALDEILGPSSTGAPKPQQRQARSAAQWLAIACRYSTEQSSHLHLAIGPQLLAASLLPLYRCLATGDLCEGLRQTQLRLRETLCLLAVCQEVGPALVELLDSPNARLDSPHVVLSREFNLSLPHVAHLLDEINGEVNTECQLAGGQFSLAAIERLQSFDIRRSHLTTLAWAAPELLWNLAGKLTSENAELKLPYSQTDTHLPWNQLPWNQIVDHWHSMLLLLNRPLLPDPAADSDGSSPSPKVVISEIPTHKEPSFVDLIRHQIGICRCKDRALSLVSLVVMPEDTTLSSATSNNVLNVWQQKLVSWLADQPQVVEPHAFVTGEGELLLCILDLERNETTALLRHGLVEVLTGQHFDDSRGNLLAQVDAPARYHAGIASTSSPGAHFSPEQLIDPAMRCLSAARQHGKASIKSIEVY